MDITSIYPVLMVENVAEAADFYRRHFGFEDTFSSDWYISLRKGDHELAFLRFDHETIPEGHRARSRGLLINVEVDDARACHDRLVGEGRLDPIQALRDEAFGQRHFILRDPAGVLVDVIQNIPPSEEHAAGYAD